MKYKIQIMFKDIIFFTDILLLKSVDLNNFCYYYRIKYYLYSNDNLYETVLPRLVFITRLLCHIVCNNIMHYLTCFQLTIKTKYKNP